MQGTSPQADLQMPFFFYPALYAMRTIFSNNKFRKPPLSIARKREMDSRNAAVPYGRLLSVLRGREGARPSGAETGDRVANLSRRGLLTPDPPPFVWNMLQLPQNSRHPPAIEKPREGMGTSAGEGGLGGVRWRHLQDIRGSQLLNHLMRLWTHERGGRVKGRDPGRGPLKQARTRP